MAERVLVEIDRYLAERFTTPEITDESDLELLEEACRTALSVDAGGQGGDSLSAPPQGATPGNCAVEEPEPCIECDAPAVPMWACNTCGTRYTAEVGTCGQLQPPCDGEVSYAGEWPNCFCNVDLTPADEATTEPGAGDSVPVARRNTQPDPSPDGEAVGPDDPRFQLTKPPYVPPSPDADQKCLAAKSHDYPLVSNEYIRDALVTAWGLIANGKAWDDRDTGEWAEARNRWRDEQFHPLLELLTTANPDEGRQAVGDKNNTPDTEEGGAA